MQGQHAVTGTRGTKKRGCGRAAAAHEEQHAAGRGARARTHVEAREAEGHARVGLQQALQQAEDGLGLVVVHLRVQVLQRGGVGQAGDGAGGGLGHTHGDLRHLRSRGDETWARGGRACHARAVTSGDVW